ncbi:MAG: hypothetical protein ACTSPB_00705 [Candidatus Thorarchaeota archaeon]
MEYDIMLEWLVLNLDLILSVLFVIALVYEVGVYVSKLLFREVYLYQSDYMRTPRKIGRLISIREKAEFKNKKSSKTMFKCVIANKTRNPLAPIRSPLIFNKNSIISQDKTSITFNKSNMFWLASQGCYILTKDFADSQKERPRMINGLIESQLVDISSNAMKSAEASPPLIHQTLGRNSLSLDNNEYAEDEAYSKPRKDVYDVVIEEDEFMKIVSQDLPDVDDFVSEEDKDFMPSRRTMPHRSRPKKVVEDDDEDVHQLQDNLGDFVG